MLAMFVSIILAACGGSDDKSSGDNKDNNSSGDGGGTLIFGRGGDSVSLDPITVTDGESFAVTQN